MRNIIVDVTMVFREILPVQMGNPENIFFACEKIQKLFFKKSERHALAKLELSQFPKFPQSPAIFISVAIPLIFHFAVGEKRFSYSCFNSVSQGFWLKYAEKLSSITGASWGIVRGASCARIGKQIPNQGYFLGRSNPGVLRGFPEVSGYGYQEANPELSPE